MLIDLTGPFPNMLNTSKGRKIERKCGSYAWSTVLPETRRLRLSHAKMHWHWLTPFSTIGFANIASPFI